MLFSNNLYWIIFIAVQIMVTSTFQTIVLLKTMAGDWLLLVILYISAKLNKYVSHKVWMTSVNKFVPLLVDFDLNMVSQFFFLLKIKKIYRDFHHLSNGMQFYDSAKTTIFMGTRNQVVFCLTFTLDSFCE